MYFDMLIVMVSNKEDVLEKVYVKGMNLCVDFEGVVGVLLDEIIICEDIVVLFDVLFGEEYGLIVEGLDVEVIM